MRKLSGGGLKNAHILPQYTFTVGDWETDPARVKDGFEGLAWKGNVIVRSSSLSEDTEERSQAGKYESVAGVSGGVAFEDAVRAVIASYDDRREGNQVLVQPMLTGVGICGVAFTLEPSTLGNYYVVNYDEGGSTDAITSGQGGKGRLYYHFKDAPAEDAPEELRGLILALGELEDFFGQDNLDVEFATVGGEVYVLQVRALCVVAERIDRESQRRELARIEERVEEQQGRKPFLCGERAEYSVMTDWNPAEMIGTKPKPLALSLYREIITDSVWAYQRDNYGYRNLRSFPLMVDFCGLPYIDVRVSFNSFVPAELDDAVSEKLVNYYLDRLAERPQKHDKAEFEIVFSCYTLDLPERIGVLGSYGFSREEVGRIGDALRNVTNRIIDFDNGIWRRDEAKIHVLEDRYGKILSGGLDKVGQVYWLLEDCKRYGTLPFAGLARGAFIAVQLLQSMVTCGILTQGDYELFMKGVSTVGTGMKLDKRELSRRAFIEKYGHLRPGTYDIGSPRYDEAPDLYFDWGDSEGEQGEDASGVFHISLEQMNRLKGRLSEIGLTDDILKLLNYIKAVIEGREYGKFVFTRNLSKALSLISEIGEGHGLSRDECAYLDIQAVRKLYGSTCDAQRVLADSVAQGKEAYRMTQGIVLPPFLMDKGEAWRFFYPDSEPNFVTSGRVMAGVCVLGDAPDAGRISGKVVLIPSADPGFDWIFSHGVVGLVTMYGGANSHMAIRAGELGIPAAIGVGAKEFERCRGARALELDCASKVIRVLR